MAARDIMSEYLYNIPPAVLYEFCRVMDSLSNSDWTRFASAVLSDQTQLRLAERREERTAWVMNHWGFKNSMVGDLINLLECQELLRARDIILSWSQYVKPPPLPSRQVPQLLSSSRPNSPRPNSPRPSPTLPTRTFNPTEVSRTPLPRPGPPPSSLQSGIQQHTQPPSACMSVLGGGAMCWSYEELEEGTDRFSEVRQIGEGGFGNVYKATMRNTTYAVKRLKKDGALDWSLVKESFSTEMDKLSQYRHPNIVELLGYSIGGGNYCLLYNYMELGSLEDQLHKVAGSLSWTQRVSILEGASRALQFLHCSPIPLIHGDVKSSNILLDQYLVPKLGDFGLARFSQPPDINSGGKSASVALTSRVRGTLPYLPDEYVFNGELGTAVDVYSFGVVLLEVLTGRRALEMDTHSKPVYLRDLVLEAQDSASGTSGSSRLSGSQSRWVSAGLYICQHHLDTNIHIQSDVGPTQRSAADGSVEVGGPVGCVDLCVLAVNCLHKPRKKRPEMKKVFEKIQDVSGLLQKTFPRPPPPVSMEMGLCPLEDAAHCLSLSSSPSRTPPPPHHSASHPSLSSSVSSSFSSPSSLSSSHSSLSSHYSLRSASFVGPCESDESQGYSQYSALPKYPGHAALTGKHSPPNLYTSDQYRSSSQSPRHQFPSVSCLTGNVFNPSTQPVESQYSPPLLTTEHQYNQYTGPVKQSMTSSTQRSQSPRNLPSTGGALPGTDTRGASIGATAGTSQGNYLGACSTQRNNQELYLGTYQGNDQASCSTKGNHEGCSTFKGNYQGPSPASTVGSLSAPYQGPCRTQGPYPGDYGIREAPSPVGSLRSVSPANSGGQSSREESRAPEESDELDYHVD